MRNGERTHRLRTRRGSAMIMVMLMVLATAAVVVTAAAFGNSSLLQETRYQDLKTAQATWDAFVSEMDAQEAAGTLSLPSNQGFKLNSTYGVISVTDNSANLANSILITGTLTTPDGRTYPESSIISKVPNNTPFDYAIFVNGSFSNGAYTINTGSSGSNGDIFSNGAIALSGSGSASSNVINGNISAAGAISTNNITETGTTASGATSITFPSVTSAEYSAVETTTTSNNNITGVTFSNPSLETPYPVLYCSNGGVTISGTVSGIGTVYFNGSVSVNGNMSYANSSSCAVFIVNGSLTTNGSTLVGYWFVTGSYNDNGSGLSLARGGMAVGSYSASSSTNVTLDPTVKNSPTTGNMLHLPGYTW